ncbi:hypothetical protein Fcan01_16005 [Folsomia candida]|uniref:Uncharacterized protein n=1 Tax=Folsomia candida TaxID=158441 RepID=A0A226E020_FOLCA|nr:hypothetical protein Fcan01_16005 [Folsomia candida]
MLRLKFPETWINSFEQFLKLGNMTIEKLTSLIFMSVTLLVSCLDCGYRAWTIYSRPVNEFPIADLLTEMGNLVAPTAPTIAGWELLFRRKQWALFFNSFVKLDDNLKRKFGDAHTYKKYKALSRFVYMIGIASIANPIFGALPQQVKDRHHRQYWGSQLLPRSIYDHPVIAVLFIIRLLSITVPMSSQLEIFSSLKILNILHNELSARVLWPIFENTLLAMQVIVHVTMIRFLANVQPSFILTPEIVLGLAMIFQGKCIKAGAKMVVISSQFKKDVRRFGNKFEKKVAKSLHPLRVNIGPFYYYKASTFTSEIPRRHHD